ncbi:hypothetical protein TIFTF001_009077 [Ficus carica]|uniref:Uncharacterized protein n=1 Tax=Ficus carica TaxID=3494 RepID=A0AA87ZU34_FICCA|nr:hypothetical protein TIFTF001_009077 [Ficus carica]
MIGMSRIYILVEWKVGKCGWRLLEVVWSCDALSFHDDYFRFRINEEIPFVARFVPTELLGSYEHPLQICTTSTLINERITGFNPTPITDSNPTLEETVHEEVPNEDDGVNNAGDDVPEEGDEVRKGCDGVPKKDDGVPEGGDDLHERVYDSRCRRSEFEEARFVSLISYDSGRRDGSDLMTWCPSRHGQLLEYVEVNPTGLNSGFSHQLGFTHYWNPFGVSNRDSTRIPFFEQGHCPT